MTLFNMELPLQTLPFASSTTIRGSKPKDCSIWTITYSPSINKPLQQRRKKLTASWALPETAASVAVAATVIGAAATLLVRRTKASEENEVSFKTCQDCGGSGICPECRGEGFVLKKVSEESAERARLSSKNAATRYTAGLPKKWSYCTKCSSARSCSACGGSGKLSLT